MNKLDWSLSRNPIITLIVDDIIVNKILNIGDPHLGRKFITGVPSDRIGEREEQQFKEFETLLNPIDPLITHINIVGDLFDKFIVSPTVVLKAFDIISKAVKNNNILYTIIPGNHDLSKDKDKKSSYEVLYNLLNGISPKLTILLNDSYYFRMNDALAIYYDCYSPFEKDDVDFSLVDTEFLISVGHWDSLVIIDHGYTPTKELLKASTLVISGHEHTYKEYVYPYDSGKTPVLFTGSMQPYSHAEDPDKNYYITLTEKEYLENTLDLTNKCVRLRCKPNFVLDSPVNCLAFSYDVVKEDVVVKTTEEVLSEFDYGSSIISYLDEYNKDFSHIIEEIRNIIKDKEYLN